MTYRDHAEYFPMVEFNSLYSSVEFERYLFFRDLDLLMTKNRRIKQSPRNFPDSPKKQKLQKL